MAIKYSFLNTIIIMLFVAEHHSSLVCLSTNEIVNQKIKIYSAITEHLTEEKYVLISFF